MNTKALAPGPAAASLSMNSRTLRRTPFHALASALGAQMGPVGGGFLNAHSYGDVAGEHLNTRANVGVQDLSTMGKIDIKGPEAEALVNHLIVNDAARMAPGQARDLAIALSERHADWRRDCWRVEPTAGQQKILRGSQHGRVIDILQIKHTAQQLHRWSSGPP